MFSNKATGPTDAYICTDTENVYGVISWSYSRHLIQNTYPAVASGGVYEYMVKVSFPDGTVPDVDYRFPIVISTSTSEGHIIHVFEEVNEYTRTVSTDSTELEFSASTLERF